MHLLSSEKRSYSVAICHKCLEHSVVFPAHLFLKQIASHVSGDTLQLNLTHFILEGFKAFCSVNERQVIEKYDGKNVFL